MEKEDFCHAKEIPFRSWEREREERGEEERTGEHASPHTVEICFRCVRERGERERESLLLSSLFIYLFYFLKKILNDFNFYKFPKHSKKSRKISYSS